MAKLQEFLGWCQHLEIPAITAWVLSTDNLRRPAEELDPYYAVLVELLDEIPRLSERLNFSFQAIGSLDLLPSTLTAAAKTAEQHSVGTGFRVNLALGYGGRQEIVDATRSLVTELAASGVDAAGMAERIDTAGIRAPVRLGPARPRPRHSNERRVEAVGLFVVAAAYAECVFVDPYWPAFRRVDFLRALRDYARRERRFGQ